MLIHSNLFVLTFFFSFIGTQANIYPTAGLNTTWTSNTSDVNHIRFDLPGVNMSAIPVLLRAGNGLSFVCGFYGQAFTESYFLAVLIVQTDSRSIINTSVAPVVAWSANRNHPVGNQATLELTEDGDLVLKDAGGYVAWSTQTSNKSVAGINLTDTGNLVLFDENSAAVWESFDDPKDTLLPGQKLRVGQRLTPSHSVTNVSELGMSSLSLTTEGLFAQVETKPPYVYYSKQINFPNTGNDSNYVEFTQGQIALFVNFTENGTLFAGSHPSLAMQYLRFESDGHLRTYQQVQNGWNMTYDILSDFLGNVNYPMACGPYGIIDSGGDCRCPGYFKQIDDSNPTLGCSEIVPLSCEASRFQTLTKYNYLTYHFYERSPGTIDLGVKEKSSCREACANNCSCLAAVSFLIKNPDVIQGDCFLLSNVFTIVVESFQDARTSTVFIKVQNPPSGIQIPPSEPPEIQIQIPPSETPDYPSKHQNHVPHKNNKMARVILIVIVTSSLGSLSVFIFLIVVKKLPVRNNGVHEVEDEKGIDEAEEEYLDQILGAPKRFNYDDLTVITEDFNKTLGEGGFGSVYRGTLANGAKVAVKQLKVLSQTKKSFLAEVETIGNIHHVNLVRLVGFCAEKFHRLLVYEYMSKGSLDKWIFHQSDESFMLDWRQRRKIIYDIAKGLYYLHEQCSWKIIHMDIKPQNILLDENFNAKVADFGLSKLLDRDKSQTVTTMRGTPGYLAPEWLHSSITEKVDVYSFGVVTLEIVCGRKVFKETQDHEDMHLLEIFKRKSKEGQLSDIIDKNIKDLRFYKPHIIDMMRLAAWCLQIDFRKRPSMSTIIKVLEGVMDVPGDLDYNFLYPTFMDDSVRIGQELVEFGTTNSVVPFILSGPR